MKYLTLVIIFLCSFAFGRDHWDQLHKELTTKCAKNDASCAGHILLDGMRYLSGLPGGGMLVYKDIFCICDSSTRFSCIAGKGSNEVTIAKDVYIGTAALCKSAVKTVTARGRFCDSNTYLHRVDLKALKFVKVKYMGSDATCYTATGG